MDDELVDALRRLGRGRLTYDPVERRLLHVRVEGGSTPLFATAAEVRELMTLLLLSDPEPQARDRAPLDAAVPLLLDLLDEHPLRAVLGMAHLRAAALGDGSAAHALGGHRAATPLTSV